MKFKFLILVAVIITMVLNVSAEENTSGVSLGIQEYNKNESNLSDVNAEIDILKADIEKTEQESSQLNDRKVNVEEKIKEKNAEIIDIGNNIESTKNDMENMESKKSEFDANKGFNYRIASMLPAFIIGVWISIIILIFVWRGE